MNIPEPVFTDTIAKTFHAYIDENNFSDVIILCDSNTHKYCLPLLESRFKSIEVAAGEESKSLHTLARITENLLEIKADRNVLLVNLGGGMVTDLGGFLASVYKRGVSFINIPTTLLAMADAAIGGKTGLDIANHKNQIGTFYQAQNIFISAQFLKTLPEIELVCGMAEIIKTAVMCNSQLFEDISNERPLNDLIRLCAKSKTDLVRNDVYDQAERQLLNFGHTYAHAYEALSLESNSPVKHGIAVARGMLSELELALHLGLIHESDKEKISNLIIRKTGVSGFTEDELRLMHPYMLSDKKNNSGLIVFSLPSGIGKGRTGIALKSSELLSVKKTGIS
jgi:3-dehydroquinate synthase